MYHSPVLSAEHGMAEVKAFWQLAYMNVVFNESVLMYKTV